MKGGGTFQRTEGALGFIFNSNLAPPPSLYKTLPAIISPTPHKNSSMLVHTCNPSIWKAEVEGSEVQGCPAPQGLVSEKTKPTQRL